MKKIRLFKKSTLAVFAAAVFAVSAVFPTAVFAVDEQTAATIETRATLIKLGENVSGRFRPEVKEQAAVPAKPATDKTPAVPAVPAVAYEKGNVGTNFTYAHDHTYTFALSGRMALSLRIRSEASNTQYYLINSSGKLMEPSEKEYTIGTGVTGSGTLTSMAATPLAVGATGTSTAKAPAKDGITPTAGSQLVWSEVIGRSDATFKYDLPMDTYYIGIYKVAGKGGSGSKTAIADGDKFDLFLTNDTAFPAQEYVPVAPRNVITSGVTQIVNLRRYEVSPQKIEIEWNKIDYAQYAVYYCYRNNRTGTFSDWTVKGVEVNGFNIMSPALGVTYYITVLPYTDTPSRMYGRFSNYLSVNTDI